MRTLLCMALLVGVSLGLGVRAEDKPDDYGGLASYPVPSAAGGNNEFQFCVLYGKRAWRVANQVLERSISLTQAKSWARQGLGKSAAEEELADLGKWERHEWPTASMLGAERFYRCAERLKLNPQPNHKAAADMCFMMLTPLDLSARQRALDEPRDVARKALQARFPQLPESVVDHTIQLAYAGESIKQDSNLIENAFAECFAVASTRAGGKQ